MPSVTSNFRRSRTPSWPVCAYWISCLSISS
uniref:Uncharacterized protein n=1 Tax=Anguilla anguilla TaxID=7936 RepID=A0A0E9VPA1_ANGAN